MFREKDSELVALSGSVTGFRLENQLHPSIGLPPFRLSTVENGSKQMCNRHKARAGQALLLYPKSPADEIDASEWSEAERLITNSSSTLY